MLLWHGKKCWRCSKAPGSSASVMKQVIHVHWSTATSLGNISLYVYSVFHIHANAIQVEERRKPKMGNSFTLLSSNRHHIILIKTAHWNVQRFVRPSALTSFSLSLYRTTGNDVTGNSPDFCTFLPSYIPCTSPSGICVTVCVVQTRGIFRTKT